MLERCSAITITNIAKTEKKKLLLCSQDLALPFTPHTPPKKEKFKLFIVRGHYFRKLLYKHLVYNHYTHTSQQLFP